MNRILTALSTLEGVAVRRAFSSEQFDITDKTPVITLGLKSANEEKTSVDEGNFILENSFYVGVFTHKSFGLGACEDLALSVLDKIKPITEKISISKAEYITPLKRFRCEIALTLPREYSHTI